MIEGAGENRTNEQTRTMIGVNSEQKESMQHYISHSIYGLTLAWITSENSTKQLECRHLLTRSSFTGPYLLCYCLTATVSGVNCPCPWFHANSRQLLSPTNSLPASRYLFRPHDINLNNWKCPWWNGYRRRKWTLRHEFKSCTRLIAFHIALIPFGKVWIHLFSLQLWVNSRAD